LMKSRPRELLACATAQGSEPEAVLLGEVLVTTKVDGTSRASSTSSRGRMPRGRVVVALGARRLKNRESDSISDPLAENGSPGGPPGPGGRASSRPDVLG